MRLLRLPHRSADHVLAVDQCAVAVKDDQFQRFVSAVACQARRFMAFCPPCKGVAKGPQYRSLKAAPRGGGDMSCGLRATPGRQMARAMARARGVGRNARLESILDSATIVGSGNQCGALRTCHAIPALDAGC